MDMKGSKTGPLLSTKNDWTCCVPYTGLQQYTNPPLQYKYHSPSTQFDIINCHIELQEKKKKSSYSEALELFCDLAEKQQDKRLQNL